MLDQIQPYKYKFIQKASPNTGDAFCMSYIFKFFTERSVHTQSLKYIIRVEQYDNAYALKFYAARDRKDINKYHRTINIHGYTSTLRLLMTCLAVVPYILSNINNKASFVVNGANSRDLRNRTEEDTQNNQRFRIYKGIVLRKISDQIFQHFYIDETSSFVLVNKQSTQDYDKEFNRLIKIFSDIYDI